VSATGPGKFYNAGDAVSVSGTSGSDLPAFSATVVSPNDIVVTSPASACASGACPDVDRSTALTLTWTAGGAGTVAADFRTAPDTSESALTCTFDAVAGTGTIPSAALMKLDVGPAPNFSGHMDIYPIDSKIVMVGTVATLFGVQGGTLAGTFTTTN
jgi:hypothetical protein